MVGRPGTEQPRAGLWCRPPGCPALGSVPDPSLTCPRCGDNFGLAAGTISLGGVGGDGNRIGGLWGQAADGGFLRMRRDPFPSPRSKEASPCQPPQDLSRWGVSGAHGAGGAVPCWALPDAGQAGGACAREDPPVPGAARLEQTAPSSFQVRTKGYTVPPLHRTASDTSRGLCIHDTQGTELRTHTAPRVALGTAPRVALCKQAGGHCSARVCTHTRARAPIHTHTRKQGGLGQGATLQDP